jgi:hypothetical protein
MSCSSEVPPPRRQRSRPSKKPKVPADVHRKEHRRSVKVIVG